MQNGQLYMVKSTRFLDCLKWRRQEITFYFITSMQVCFFWKGPSFSKTWRKSRPDPTKDKLHLCNRHDVPQHFTKQYLSSFSYEIHMK